MGLRDVPIVQNRPTAALASVVARARRIAFSRPGPTPREQHRRDGRARSRPDWLGLLTPVAIAAAAILQLVGLVAVLGLLALAIGVTCLYVGYRGREIAGLCNWQEVERGLEREARRARLRRRISSFATSLRNRAMAPRSGANQTGTYCKWAS
jgi:hypothetical protein